MEVHFTSAAHLTENVIQAVAEKFATAFLLQKVDLICDGDGIKCRLPEREDKPEVIVTGCDGEPLPEDIPFTAGTA